MSEIVNIPELPVSTPPDLVELLRALSDGLSLLQGLGRSLVREKALRFSDLERFGISIEDFLNATRLKPVPSIGPGSAGGAPWPPTDLTIARGAFVHVLQFKIPDDKRISHIQVWVAKNSQSRSNAKNTFVFTVKDYGTAVIIRLPIDDVTAEYTYWIRSISFAKNHSTWEPPDSQGGYVVDGDDSVQTTVSKVLEILNGEITESELYAALNTRIDLIDASGTGLIDRVATIEATMDSLGDWVSGDPYTEDDVVIYNDKIYICILDTVSPHTELPTNTTYWEKIGESASLAGNIAANSSAVTVLDARVDDNDTDIIANASDITDLEATVNNGSTGVSANASAISALDVRVEDNEDGISAQSTLITNLRTDVDDNEADITTEQIARASGDTANATNINAVGTTVGEHSTFIQTNLTSINGIQGKYTVKIDNNGYLTGYGLISTNNNGTPTSEFIILADKFQIVTPGEDPQVPFVVGEVDGVSTVGIDGNLVVDGTILSPAIQADAVKAAHIDANEVYVGLQIQSTSYVAGTSGWKINNTLAEFNDIVMTFTSSTERTAAQSALNVADGADVTDYSNSAIANSELSDLAWLDTISNTYLDDNCVQARNVNVTNLQALHADTGDLTVNGELTMDSQGSFHSWACDSFADSTAGWWLGLDSGAYKFRLGTLTEGINWDGSTFNVLGDVIATGNVKAHNINIPVVSTLGGATTGTGADRNIQSITVVMPHAGTILLWVSIDFDYYTGAYWHTYITIGGVEVFRTGESTTAQMSVTMMGARVVSAGTYVCKLWWRNDHGSNICNRRLMAAQGIMR
ncbi:MAG: hypothetical protein DRH26_03665 [Deltaproteobacteria bacterium]|nr:MAG: hypothetical protein DRH26_03665 [Deltaproteobacteria bacterium]